MNNNTHAHEPPESYSLGWLHWLLTAQSVIIILGSINRLSSLTVDYVAPNEFLRWMDLHNMLTLPLFSLVIMIVLKEQIERFGPTAYPQWHRLLTALFVVAAFTLGVGRGNHEVTNYLNSRFCLEQPNSEFCPIIAYNDDVFSHWVWFAGFVLISATLMGVQAIFPIGFRLSRRDAWLILANSLLVALGIVANLAFEQIGSDLVIVIFVAVLAWILIWWRGWQPLILYYGFAFSVGAMGTAIVKSSGGL